MKGPLGAERLFFISSLVFVAGFILGSALNYIWPVPPEAMLPAVEPANTLGMISWVLSIAGVVTFVRGLIARR